jgi:hypothetical protein
VPAGRRRQCDAGVRKMELQGHGRIADVVARIPVDGQIGFGDLLHLLDRLQNPSIVFPPRRYGRNKTRHRRQLLAHVLDMPLQA